MGPGSARRFRRHAAHSWPGCIAPAGRDAWGCAAKAFACRRTQHACAQPTLAALSNCRVVASTLLCGAQRIHYDKGNNREGTMLIDDIEYVIFRHPDPAAERQFLLDFGLLDREQKGDSVYMRSYGNATFSYVTSKGDAAFVGMGFRVASREALDSLGAKFGSGITECPHP